MDGVAIEIDALRKRFRSGLEAVAGIDLDVAEGEVYAFLGPNGAGKTTTVRMLVTLLAPSGGHARVAGFDVVRNAGEVRRSIGVALQEAALDPLMTGAELMRLQATLHGIRKKEARIRSDALLERVGLARAADRRVGTYSGGMRRRLDLAMALVHEPRVLFLDEPTTGLDPQSRMALWNEVRKLNDEGTTVFLTTQYLEEADQLADRVGIIDGGRMVAEGTPAGLKEAVRRPHVEVIVEEEGRARATEVLAARGELLPSRDGELSVGLDGAGQVASVVRALDEAGVCVESLEFIRPSLDDVFLAKTGHRLEGASSGDVEEPEAVPTAGSQRE